MENKYRKLAVLVTVLLIAFSSFFGVYRTLSSEVKNMNTIFFRDGIYHDILKKSGQAANLITVAEKNKIDVDTKKLKSAIEAVNNSDNPSEIIKNDRIVGEQAEILYDKIMQSDIPPVDANAAEDVKTNIISLIDIIGRNSYHEKAIAANDMFSQFPASALSKLLFMNKAAVYE